LIERPQNVPQIFANLHQEVESAEHRQPEKERTPHQDQNFRLGDAEEDPNTADEAENDTDKIPATDEILSSDVSCEEACITTLLR
jgi:hypothetical protein